MFPLPHLLAFLPICVFGALFAAAVAVNAAAARPRQPKPMANRTPAGRTPAGRTPAGRTPPSAEIIYFRPRKTPLPSGLSLGAR